MGGCWGSEAFMGPLTRTHAHTCAHARAHTCTRTQARLSWALCAPKYLRFKIFDPWVCGPRNWVCGPRKSLKQPIIALTPPDTHVQPSHPLPSTRMQARSSWALWTARCTRWASRHRLPFLPFDYFIFLISFIWWGGVGWGGRGTGWAARCTRWASRLSFSYLFHLLGGVVWCGMGGALGGWMDGCWCEEEGGGLATHGLQAKHGNASRASGWAEPLVDGPPVPP